MSTLVQAGGAGRYVVNLRGFTPSARPSGSGPWDSVRIDESSAEAGAITATGTAALIADPDPESPASIDFQFVGATLSAGWYQVSFLDDAGNEQPTEWVFNGPPIRPSVQDIGTLLHNRTTVDGGSEAGTFNDDTDPTGEQVERIIDIAVGQIAIQLPDDITAKQTVLARTMVAYLAAILVENSHFSDQVQTGDSLAAMYQTFLDTGLATLSASVDGELPGGPTAFSITTETDTQDTYGVLSSAGRNGYCCGWDTP